MLRRFAVTAVWLSLSTGLPAWGAVRVVVGPTPIAGGEARAAGDITVVGEKLAFGIAVGTAVPYGVPRGAIIDLAPVVDGAIGRDRVVFADFIPNNWSAWPNTYQHVDILESGPARVVVRAVRDFGRVTIETVYTLAAGSDAIELVTTMHNDGDVVLPNLLSGFTLWPKGGYLFGVPGLRGAAEGSAASALATRVVGYDEDWSVALHAPYLDQIGDGSRDLYALHSLSPGETRRFQAWLQVGARGDLAPVLGAEIARSRTADGRVRGRVFGSDGKPVDSPVVVVERQGETYGWALGRHGRYELQLAAGDYRLYATAKGRSESTPIALEITSGADEVRDFRGVDGPARLRFVVTNARDGTPLDARIAIAAGSRPVVEFLGKKTFFTELDARGRVEMPIAPGRYTFTISAGGGFSSEVERRTLDVDARAVQTLAVGVTPLFRPSDRGWYSADLHHHADQAEAVTPPEWLARSQLAAGLDLLFVSDHDSTVNHRTLQRIADRRGIAFIPSIELSPSWGHFNAYPLSLGLHLGLDTGTATIDAILAEAHRLGASVVQANHPFIPYGYLTSVQAGVAPGGFNPGFDLLEINAANSDDDGKVLQQLQRFWDAGRRYYLSAGTDTHDVWNEESGRVRAFVHLDAAPTAAAFAQGLKDGHAYVSYGPLIFPSVLFGTQLRAASGVPIKLGFDLQSVAGLRKVAMIGSGGFHEERAFPDAPRERHVDYSVMPEETRWLSLIVEDRDGHKAYTDPIWIAVVDRP
jgi:hypothetical protein